MSAATDRRRRIRRAIVGSAFLLAVVVLLGANTLLLARGAFDHPVDVMPGLVGVRSFGGVWCYAARAGDRVILFDAGMDSDGDPVVALVAALGDKLERVTDVFLTHGHADHTAGLAVLPGARVHAGEADAPFVEGKRFPGVGARIAAFMLSTGPAPVSHRIERAETDAVPGGEVVRAIPVPGHTAGSMAYLYRGVLFAGDALGFKNGRLEPGPPLFDLAPDAAWHSARALARDLASSPPLAVCTGHDGCTPVGAAPRLLAAMLAAGTSLHPE